MKEYKTVNKNTSAVFIEKKSRFIGHCAPVSSENDAIEYINKIKSKYWDATHNVYAYVLNDGQIMRYSDDGEPQGTAGIPVLDVIRKNSLTNTVIVVTRYFGGILLGAGGLVRAYTHSAKIAVENSEIIFMRECLNCKISCSYSDYGKINSLILNNGAIIDNTDFFENVDIFFHISEANNIKFEKDLADITNGQIKINLLGKQFYKFFK